jgi:hypothetical protein
MDKIGQILKDHKMAAISKQNDLAGRITARGGHFPPISLPFCRLEDDIDEFMT